MTALAKDERALAVYQMCLVAGILVTVKNGVLQFDPQEKVTPILQRQIEANKAELIEYIGRLPKTMTPEQYAVIDRLIPSLRMITWIRRVMAQQVERTKVQPPSEFMEWLDTAEKLRTEQIDILDEADWQALFELAF